MNATVYKNELMVLVAFLVLIGTFFYKHNVVDSQGSSTNDSTQLLQDIKESIALKALWGDKKITKKIEALKFGISPSQFGWSKKGKKLSATFKKISAKELNALMKKLLNIAVEIQRLEITKLDLSYTLELKCKW
jgi:hypothetical protein